MSACHSCGADLLIFDHDADCPEGEIVPVLEALKPHCPVCGRTDLFERMGWRTCPVHGSQKGMNGNH